MKINKQAIYLILLFAFIFIIEFAISQNVFLYGDDFHYGTYYKYGLMGFFDKHIYHYITINGRAIVHFLVSVLLIFDVYLWRILNPLLIISVIYLIGKVSKCNTIYNNILIAFLFMTIPISIARETIFWLDGSMNYLYPCLIMFLSVNFFSKSFDSGNKLYYLPFITFISGASTEQVGMMSFGLILIEFCAKVFLWKQKFNKWQVISIISCFVGYLSVAFAPGTFVRMGLEGKTISVMSLTKILNFYIFNSSTFLVIFLVTVISISWLVKMKTSRLNIIVIVALCFWLICYTLNFLKIIDLTLVHYISLSFIFVWILLLIYVFVCTLILYKDYRSLSFFIVSIGAQIMLIPAADIRYRTLLCSILALFVPITIGIINLKKQLRFIVMFVVIIVGSANTFNIYKGYKSNRQANINNLNLIQSMKENPEIEFVVISQMVNDDYYYTPLQYSNYHIAELTKYYELKENSVFIEPAENIVKNNLILNGEKVMLNYPPLLKNDVYYLAIGELANKFNFSITWNEIEGKIFIDRYGEISEFNIGSNIVIVEGKEIVLSCSLEHINNRNLVPLDFLEKVWNYNITILPNPDGGVNISVEN